MQTMDWFSNVILFMDFGCLENFCILNLGKSVFSFEESDGGGGKISIEQEGRQNLCKPRKKKYVKLGLESLVRCIGK